MAGGADGGGWGGGGVGGYRCGGGEDCLDCDRGFDVSSAVVVYVMDFYLRWWI